MTNCLGFGNITPIVENHMEKMETEIREICIGIVCWSLLNFKKVAPICVLSYGDGMNGLARLSRAQLRPFW